MRRQTNSHHDNSVDSPAEHKQDDELLVGWSMCRIGDVFSVSSGGTPSRNRSEFWNGTIPWLSSGDIKSDEIETGSEFITEAGLNNSTAKLCRPGSIVVVVRSGILKHTLPVAVLRRPAAINQDMKCFDSGEDDLNRWLALVLKASARIILAENREGTTVQSVKSDTLRDLEIPVPPFAEQRRIVAKLELLLAKVSSSQQRLSRIPSLLKRFRQSVLAAACSGRLTADWRKENAVTETAEEFVTRIQEERREEFRAKTERAKHSGERKPKMPRNEFVSRIEVARNGSPSSWCTTRIGDVCECLDHLRIPINKTERQTRQGPIPYYGANGQVGWIDEYLFDEDLVLVVEDESFIGREKPFSYVVRGKCWVNNHAHVLRPLGGMPADFLDICLAYYDFVPLTSGTTGRRKLNQEALVDAPLMIGPLSEQHEIVRRVEKLFAFADQIEARLKHAQAHVDRLTQSLLAKAFRGELVPTEAELARQEGRSYESAERLLARVKAERTSEQGGSERTTRRPKRAEA